MQAESAEKKSKLAEKKSKMKTVKRHDDFNFHKIFAAREAGYTGVISFN